jgi:ParB family transcriptional regulator, chromosome partitioning protein
MSAITLPPTPILDGPSVRIRYMGNKHELAGSVAELVEAFPSDRPFLDLFCGMCSVGAAIAPSGRAVWGNDVQWSASTVAKCLLTSASEPVGGDTLRTQLECDYQRNLAILEDRFKAPLTRESQILTTLDVDAFAREYASWRHVGNSHARLSEVRTLATKPEAPYRLFTLTFAWGYFGLRQAAQIDSLRYAIDRARSRRALSVDGARWALLALMQAASCTASTPGHFAQYLGAGKQYVLLDGERRWRCALKLGIAQVPVIVQPKPDRLQNLMMMFAIHNQRRDWDPLPTAYKLRDLEEEFKVGRGREPTEAELAEIASISRGEVRRLKNILRLPQEYHQDLLQELEKPRAEQVLTVDHVLEATRGAQALRKRDVISSTEEEQLRRALVDKFKSQVLTSTVEPRQLARVARAVERDEVPVARARKVAMRLIREPKYSVADAFSGSVAAVDYSHGSEQLADRLANRIEEQLERDYEPTEALTEALERLRLLIDQLLE